MPAEILTTVLPRSGFRVLASNHPRFGIGGKTFVNRTQADKACAQAIAAGLLASVWQPRLGRVFYVVIDQDAASRPLSE